MSENINMSFEEMRAAILSGLNVEGGMEIEDKLAINKIMLVKEVAGQMREGLKAHIIGMAADRGRAKAIDYVEADDIFELEICCDLIAIQNVLEESVAAKEELIAVLGVGGV